MSFGLHYTNIKLDSSRQMCVRACATLSHMHIPETSGKTKILFEAGERLVKLGQNHNFLTVNGKLVDSTPNRPIVGRQ